MHTVDLDEQLVLMEKYHITSDELLFLTILLLLQDNEDYTCMSCRAVYGWLGLSG